MDIMKIIIINFLSTYIYHIKIINKIRQATSTGYSNKTNKTRSRPEEDDINFLKHISDCFYHNQMQITLSQQTGNTFNNNLQIHTNFKYENENKNIKEDKLHNLFNPKKEKIIVITNVNEKMIEKLNKQSFESADNKKIKVSHNSKFY